MGNFQKSTSVKKRGQGWGWGSLTGNQKQKSKKGGLISSRILIHSWYWGLVHADNALIVKLIWCFQHCNWNCFGVYITLSLLFNDFEDKLIHVSWVTLLEKSLETEVIVLVFPEVIIRNFGQKWVEISFNLLIIIFSNSVICQSLPSNKPGW